MNPNHIEDSLFISKAKSNGDGNGHEFGYGSRSGYGYGNGDGSMWVDTDAVRFAIIKFGSIPANCQYRLITRTKAGRPDVPGMSSTTFLSTTGFVRQSLGTTIGTHAIGAQAEYWRKA